MKIKVNFKSLRIVAFSEKIKKNERLITSPSLDTGLKDAFIISLNGFESIDATKKGSLARFINHSW